MENKLKLLALAFDTEDFIELEKWANEHKDSVAVQLPRRQSVHRLLDEVYRADVMNAPVDGILIVDHKNRREASLKRVSRLLSQRFKRLHAISFENGLQALYPLD